MPRRGPPARMLHRWHRRAGLAAATFLLLLLATGIPLQFSSALGLGQTHVSFLPLLDWYGLQAPADVRTSQGLVSVGDGLFTSESAEPVGTLAGFRGAVTVEGVLVAAGANEVLLLDEANARPLDRFRMQTPVNRLGRFGARVVVETGGGLLLADRDLVNWQPAPVPESEVVWATVEPPRNPDRYRARFRARMLTLERVLQDAHSGRLLGTPGILIVDLASALLLFLAVSGLVMWWRTFRR